MKRNRTIELHWGRDVAEVERHYLPLPMSVLRALRELGLGVMEMAVVFGLFSLIREDAPDEPVPAGLAFLGRRVAVEKHNLTRILKRLEEHHRLIELRRPGTSHQPALYSLHPARERLARIIRAEGGSF